MKILLRLLFVATVGCAYAFVDSVFMRKSVHTSKIKSFFSQSKEYDVLAFGPSYMYITLLPPELYRTTGIRSFVPGTPCQPIEETYYYIKEALARFSPKVVLLGADMIVHSPGQYVHKGSFVHEAIDGFPWGISRLLMVADLETDGEYDEFVVPFIRYHSRWKELAKEDFALTYRHNDFNGSLIYAKSNQNNVSPYDLSSCLRGKIFDRNLLLLDRIVELVKSHGCTLVLVASPRAGGFANGRLAALHDYCSKHEILLLDLLLDFDKTGISNNTDFYDRGHLNVFGAEKATRYIGKYLVDHFDFNTNITAECRAEWDAEVARYDRAKAAAIAAERKANKPVRTAPKKR